MDALAMRKGDRWTKVMMGGVVVQGIIMGRLIWWDLSWDVMEPVAYLMAFSYAAFGWAFYTISKDDIAEYGTVAGKYVANTTTKLYEQNGFSLKHYKEVEEQIAEMKRTLKAYGVVPKEDRKEYPIPCVAATPNVAADKS